MPTPKLYVPKSSAKEVTFQDGGSIIRLSFSANELIEFVKNHTNQDGWISFNVSKRREPSERGATHSISLDTWKPTGAHQAVKAYPNVIQPNRTAPAQPEQSEVPF
jgi:hypothetical protein